MLRVASRSDFNGQRSTSSSRQFAGLLQGFYQGLLDKGVPEHMAGLVRQLEAKISRSDADSRRLAIVVESDERTRALAAALLEETDLAVLECASAEAALALLQQHGASVAFVFADQELAGPRDGFDLAKAAASRWPAVHIVLTADSGRPGLDGLPASVVTLPKPWRGLDVLIEAERALAAARTEPEADT